MINRKAFLAKAVEEGFKNKVNGYPLILKHSKGRKLLDYKIYGNSVQDGTPTPDNPVEIQSVGDLVTDTNDSNYGKYKIPITITGKNYNKTLPIHKYDYSLDYKKYNSTNIAILPKGTYTLSGDYMPTIQFFDINTNERILVPDAVTYNKNFVYSAWDNYALTPTTTFVKQATITVLKDLKITLASTVGELGEFQIEEGNKATEYEPYIEPKTTNIYLNEPLRKVVDAVDYIDFKSKKVVRNVGVENLSDIRNSFHEYASMLSANGYSIYYNFSYSKTNNSDLICTHFEMNTNHLSGSNHITLKPELQRIFIGINSEIVAAADKVAFREWLFNNKPKLFYVLNAPTEQTIDLPDILTNKYTNIITVDTTIQPSKIEAEYSSFAKEV